MTEYSPTDLAAQLKSGLLSFPVTHFDRRTCSSTRPATASTWPGWRSTRVAGLFAAGGTGEGFSPHLRGDRRAWSAPPSTRSPAPYPSSLRRRARTAQRDRPGQGRRGGRRRRPPADAALPHRGQPGRAWSSTSAAVCEATDLGVVVYSRANAVLNDDAVAELADRNPTLIGFKDGVGNIEQMTRTYARVGDRLIYVGGLPTAETFALPLLQLGVSTYSSALFNFVPQWAIDFYDAVRAQDRDEVYRRLNEFVIPYLDIRDRTQGYAVSIVKGGLDRHRPPGRAGPPAADRPGEPRSPSCAPSSRS